MEDAHVQERKARWQGIWRFTNTGLVIVYALAIVALISVRIECSEVSPPEAALPPPEATLTPLEPVFVPPEALLTNSIGMSFVSIADRHYAMGMHEVTNGQFRSFRPRHYSRRHPSDPRPDSRTRSLNDDLQPAVFVNHADALAFCEWLNDLDSERQAGRTYRLPSGKEWTECCLAGRRASHCEFPWGSSWPPPPNAGNYHGTELGGSPANLIGNYRDQHPVTAPVGSYQANPWGLCDMGGNVAEWTSERIGTSAVVRGAGWLVNNRGSLRTEYRPRWNAEARTRDVGFRVVCVVESAAGKQ